MLYKLVSAACALSLVAGRPVKKARKSSVHKRCLKKDPSAPKEWIPAGMEREVPHKKYPDVSSLPSSLDWRFKDGMLLTGASTNQHMPNYCGACWAFSTTSALSDRIMIAKQDAYYEVNLAPQVLLDCDTMDDGCHGGDPLNALKYISQNGITEIGCTQYLAEGHDTGRQCTESSLCMTCSPGKTGCYDQYPYMRFGLSAYGSLTGEDEYLQAVQDGPIVTGMCVTDEVEDYIGTFYIINDTSGCTEQDHAVSIVGYGTDNSVPYWIVRNSWGTWWGQNGYFRVLRGSNNLGIEQDGTYGIPLTEATWVNTTDDVLGPAKGKTMNTGDSKKKSVNHKHQKPERPPYDDWKKYGGEVILNPTPAETMNNFALPSTWIWNDINGTNWLTKSVNQHIPVYCGSCWAQATCSSLSDRLNIQRGQAGETWFPEIHLSPQVLINNDGGGTCNGGNGIGALEYIHNYGIPDDTCQVYQAINDPHGSNHSMDECYTCEPGNTSSTFTPGTCYPIEQYYNYYVSEYGRVIGASEMKKEIYARGPITCGVDATAKFEEYTGGIYSEEQIFPLINHDISVVGWGIEDGTEFWVGRNSWGTFWGEDGYFRIEMYKNNLGIERECVWGVPTTVKPTVRPENRWNPNQKHMW